MGSLGGVFRATFGFSCLLGLAGGCGAAGVSPPMSPSLDARRQGEATRDGNIAGRWLLAELVAPGGTSQGAKRARNHLRKLRAEGLWASFSLGVDALSHGELRASQQEFLLALRAAQTSSDPLTPALAWVAANALLSLSRAAPNDAEALRPTIKKLVDAPGHVGWRARSLLLEWQAEFGSSANGNEARRLALAASGCLTHVRLAGPFGAAASAPAKRKEFAAELPGPWPARWQPSDPNNARARILSTRVQDCTVQSSDSVAEPGTFYGEAYVDVSKSEEVIVAAQGALALWVDDQKVLEREPRWWGSWPKFGVQLKLEPGRHRVVMRLEEAETSLRVLRPDGTPAVVVASRDVVGTYGKANVTVAGDPNFLSRYLDGKGRVTPPKDEVEAYLASSVAYMENQYDVANVLLESLLAEKGRAAPLALAAAASATERDPVFPVGDAQDMAKLLREHVIERDEKMWRPRLWILLHEAERNQGASAQKISALRQEFPQVPEIARALVAIYERLGWKVEKEKLVRSLREQFPNDRKFLEASVSVFEEAGQWQQAADVRARLRTLFPDSEVELDRALAQHEYAGAKAELQRLEKRYPERKTMPDRLAALSLRSGQTRDPVPLLRRALEQQPLQIDHHLALTDAYVAKGETSFLQGALANALQKNIPMEPLWRAADLIDGASDLEAYRLNGPALVREFDASGRTLQGTAARVLDYAVLLVRANGSSHMLEHELVRIQSQEAIGKLAEQPLRPEAVILRLRVLKKNGQVLEPERVEGKPTVTMPHLEVGDTIETEFMHPTPAERDGGQRYLSAPWFFREPDIAYGRSEFVVLSPRSRPLVIEARGALPSPHVVEKGRWLEHRWRVENAPAAPVEPGSVSPQEFLPSVRVGWGITLQSQMERLRASLADELPHDPRIVRIAEHIVENLEPKNVAARTQRLARWVMSNVDEGKEVDPRKIILGKRGDRGAAFLFLARCLGLPVEPAVVRSGFSPPDLGPLSSALAYGNLMFRLSECPAPQAPACRSTWFSLDDKFAPFGFVPPELRGQPAVVLNRELTRETVMFPPTHDGTIYDGTVALRADGSASLAITLRFYGRVAMSVRRTIEQLSEGQLERMIEGRLLSRTLPGARLLRATLEGKDDLDAPLTILLQADAPAFARVRGDTLVWKPPFMMMVGLFAERESRETTLLLPEAAHTEVRLDVQLPAGAKVEHVPPAEELRDGPRSFVAKDQQTATRIRMERVLDLPAGRVEVRDYERFRQFTKDADRRAQQETIVRLGVTK